MTRKYILDSPVCPPGTSPGNNIVRSTPARGDLHLQLLPQPVMLSSSGQRILIGQGWEFTQLGGGPTNDDGEWLAASKVPTSVQAEVGKNFVPYLETVIDCSPQLLKLKKIPDPYTSLNEYEVQCTFSSGFVRGVRPDAQKGSGRVIGYSGRNSKLRTSSSATITWILSSKVWILTRM